MAKRTKYIGSEEIVYLLPLDNNGLKSIPKIHRSCVKNGRYTCKFINETDIKVPFKDRMSKAADSNATVCFIFGSEEIQKNGITIKNLISGEQVFSKYEEIQEKIQTVL